MIDSKETLADYMVTNADRLGIEGQYTAKVLYWNMNKIRSLSFAQIEEVLNTFNCNRINPSKREWYLTAVAGIGIMLYPDQINNLITEAYK